MKGKHCLSHLLHAEFEGLYSIHAFEALMMRANEDRRQKTDELRLYRFLTGEFRI